MTVLTLLGAVGALPVLSGLLIFLFVMYAQLTQQAPEGAGSTPDKNRAGDHNRASGKLPD
jgi:hypothetical protein